MLYSPNGGSQKLRLPLCGWQGPMSLNHPQLLSPVHWQWARSEEKQLDLKPAGPWYQITLTRNHFSESFAPKAKISRTRNTTYSHSKLLLSVDLLSLSQLQANYFPCVPNGGAGGQKALETLFLLKISFSGVYLLRGRGICHFRFSSYAPTTGI